MQALAECSGCILFRWTVMERERGEERGCRLITLTIRLSDHGIPGLLGCPGNCNRWERLRTLADGPWKSCVTGSASPGSDRYSPLWRRSSPSPHVSPSIFVKEGRKAPARPPAGARGMDASERGELYRCHITDRGNIPTAGGSFVNTPSCGRRGGSAASASIPESFTTATTAPWSPVTSPRPPRASAVCRRGRCSRGNRT